MRAYFMKQKILSSAPNSIVRIYAYIGNGAGKKNKKI